MQDTELKLENNTLKVHLQLKEKERCPDCGSKDNLEEKQLEFGAAKNVDLK